MQSIYLRATAAAADLPVLMGHRSRIMEGAGAGRRVLVQWAGSAWWKRVVAVRAKRGLVALAGGAGWRRKRVVAARARRWLQALAGGAGWRRWLEALAGGAKC